MLKSKALRSEIEFFLQEDDLAKSFSYISSLPSDLVKCHLKIKDNMVLAGLPHFVEVFRYLGAELSYLDFEKYEGKSFKKSDLFEINFTLPFNIALTGERLSLNYLQKASSVATYTAEFVKKAAGSNIKILDTRKTTPGLRSLEKYAVKKGGGYNHRLGQTDMWMVKDNHKSFFGGLKEAIDFFKSQNTFYTPIEVEIHSIKELKEAIELKVSHLMLDNFSRPQIEEAVALKQEGMTFEVSGGVSLDNMNQFLVKGIDAISVGALTYGAPSVDLSLKYERAE